MLMTLSGSACRMLSCCDAACPAESVTCTVNGNVVGKMQKAPGEHPGTPEINPVAGFRVKVPPPIAPVTGKVPLVMA